MITEKRNFSKRIFHSLHNCKDWIVLQGNFYALTREQRWISSIVVITTVPPVICCSVIWASIRFPWILFQMKSDLKVIDRGFLICLWALRALSWGNWFDLTLKPKELPLADILNITRDRKFIKSSLGIVLFASSRHFSTLWISFISLFSNIIASNNAVAE